MKATQYILCLTAIYLFGAFPIQAQIDEESECGMVAGEILGQAPSVSIMQGTVRIGGGYKFIKNLTSDDYGQLKRELRYCRRFLHRLPDDEIIDNRVEAYERAVKDAVGLKTATDELSQFGRSLSSGGLSDANVRRLQAIRNEFPTLASEVKRIIETDANVKEQMKRTQQRIAQERAEQESRANAQRIQAEKDKEEAAAFQARLPTSCTESEALQLEFQKYGQQNLGRIAALNQTGDASICGMIGELIDHADALRLKLLECFHSLEGDDSQKAQEMAAGAASEAGGMNKIKQTFTVALRENGCSN